MNYSESPAVSFEGCCQYLSHIRQRGKKWMGDGQRTWSHSRFLHCVPNSQLAGDSVQTSLCTQYCCGLLKSWDLGLHEIRDIIYPNIYSEEGLSHTTKKNLLNKAMLVPRKFFWVWWNSLKGHKTTRKRKQWLPKGLVGNQAIVIGVTGKIKLEERDKAS